MLRGAKVKYHYLYRFFTYSVERSPLGHYSVKRGLLYERETVSGGEFGWGGTSVKE